MDGVNYADYADDADAGVGVLAAFHFDLGEIRLYVQGS